MSSANTPSDLVEIPAHIPARVLSDRQDRIPKVIYQTFKTRFLPPSMQEAVVSWIDRNPDYDYFLFDDDAMFAFVDHVDCSTFSFSRDDLIRAMRRIRPGAGKADLFRYLIIYDRGGVYMDVDTVCMAPLHSFIHPEDDVVSGIGMRGDLHQWGLIYSPRHPFMKRTLENSVSNILEGKFIPMFENTLEGLTGPPCLDVSIKHLLNLQTEAKFQTGLYEIEVEGLKTRIRLLANDLFDGNVGFKYKDYRSDLSKLGMKHWLDESLFND